MSSVNVVGLIAPLVMEASIICKAAKVADSAVCTSEMTIVLLSNVIHTNVVFGSAGIILLSAAFQDYSIRLLPANDFGNDFFFWGGGGKGNCRGVFNIFLCNSIVAKTGRLSGGYYPSVIADD